jgi:hypothetical protein
MKRLINTIILLVGIFTMAVYSQSAGHSGGWQKRAVIATTDSAVRLTTSAIPCSRVIIQALPTNVNYIAVGVTKGRITAATIDSPMVVTSANHGLASNERVTVAGVLGATTLNNDWTVTVLTANTFSVAAPGNAAYISGGIWTDISAVATKEKGDQLGALGSTVIYIDDLSHVWINGTAGQGVVWRWER